MKKKSSITALDVANVFIRKSKESEKGLTNMQLQKLVYIAFGFYAAFFNERMFDDSIQAWSYGPVIPNLYHKLKGYGLGNVTDYIPPNSGQIDGDAAALQIIDGVWDGYADKSAKELSDLTHQEGTPWVNAWNGKKNVEIPLYSIRSHYEKIVRDKVNA